jgi:diacylglycerol kinase
MFFLFLLTTRCSFVSLSNLMRVCGQLITRLLSDLVNSFVVSAADLLSLYDDLMAVTKDAAAVQVCLSIYPAVLFACLCVLVTCLFSQW